MNCSEFRELSQAIARDEALDAATLERALGHADSCEECDSLLEESEALTSELRALAKHFAAEEAPLHIEAQLLAELEQRRAAEIHGSQRPEQREAGIFGIGAEMFFALRKPFTTILGAAAAVILVMALTGWPAALWQTAWLANLGKTGQEGGSRGSSAILSAGQNEDSGADLNSDSFVPLSGAYDLASLSDDPVVRVVLSENDLENLGLPVGEGNDEQIVADLVIAHDGTPQAIRVVSW
jgi:hypothetical protein